MFEIPPVNEEKLEIKNFNNQKNQINNNKEIEDFEELFSNDKKYIEN